MSVEQLTTLSRAMLAAGALLLILAIFLYVKLDIYKVWHIVTGRKLKESYNKPKRQGIIRNSQKISTEKMKRHFMRANSEDKTEVLPSQDQFGGDKTEELTGCETEQLNLNEASHTIALGEFRLKYDVTFIHTQVKI